MPDHSQFRTDRNCLGRWTVTFSNPPINVFAPTTIAELGALMTDLDREETVDFSFRLHLKTPVNWRDSQMERSGVSPRGPSRIRT